MISKLKALLKGRIYFGNKMWTLFFLLPNGYWFPGGERKKVSWCNEELYRVNPAALDTFDPEGLDADKNWDELRELRRPLSIIRFRSPLALVWNYSGVIVPSLQKPKIFNGQ